MLVCQSGKFALIAWQAVEKLLCEPIFQSAVRCALQGLLDRNLGPPGVIDGRAPPAAALFHPMISVWP
jgi:hypothetical protein